MTEPFSDDNNGRKLFWELENEKNKNSHSLLYDGFDRCGRRLCLFIEAKRG